MPYLFKLSRRVARLRTHSLVLAAAAILGACESSHRHRPAGRCNRPRSRRGNR